MTSYNGKAITYNSNGEVTTYDGFDYSWSKGKLSTIYRALGGSSRAIGFPTLQASQTYSFGYNGLGQRVSSSYNYVNIGNLSIQRGELTAYSKKFSYDHSGRLIYETNTKTYYQEGSETYEIVYLYDENSIIGMVYTNINGTNTYYFLRNLQGDVVAIYDTNGNKVVGYTYDAWGNCTIDSTTTSYDLAHANPIRYRGYYYDEDTKLYYLNSRYYSPEWRRFISPDDTSYLDLENANGLNLYCYCNNDPVNFVDPSGHNPEWWQWALFGLGVALVAIAAGMAVFGTGGIAAFGAGALIGSAAAGGAGAGIGAAVGYATGGVDGIAGGAMTGFGIGAIVGFAVGGSIGYANFGSFASQAKLDAHFVKHGSEFGRMYSTSAEYAKGAKYVIRYGQKVQYIYKGKKTVAYIRFFGNAGKANYAFVGLNGTKVATYGIRSVYDLTKLGISLFL